MQQELRFTLQVSREVQNEKGERLALSAGDILVGTFSCEAWAGPFEVVEHGHPSYLKFAFRCAGTGRPFIVRGVLTPFDLLFANGDACTSKPPQTTHAGTPPIAWMFDHRAVISPQIDGKPETIEAKSMSSTFVLHAGASSALIHCRFYDAKNCRDYREAWYHRPYESLLFLNAPELMYDAAGNLEDFDMHGRKHVDFAFET